MEQRGPKARVHHGTLLNAQPGKDVGVVNMVVSHHILLSIAVGSGVIDLGLGAVFMSES